MTGPEHYQAAEMLLDMASDDQPGDDVETYRVAAAQVHATLALTAATALCQPDDTGLIGEELYGQWDRAAGNVSAVSP